jgi:hypothetical protein
VLPATASGFELTSVKLLDSVPAFLPCSAQRCVLLHKDKPTLVRTRRIEIWNCSKLLNSIFLMNSSYQNKYFIASARALTDKPLAMTVRIPRKTEHVKRTIDSIFALLKTQI